MLGYDISWSAFNIIEVMSSTKFTYKVCIPLHPSLESTFKCNLFATNQRIGYLAASQCFHENTEVLMLTTNMIRKVCTFISYLKTCL